MFGNSHMDVKKSTEIEAWSLCYYLYALTTELSSMESHEECQNLYFALVDRLGLEKHSEAVINAIIEKHKKNRLLVSFEPGAKYRSPFTMKGKLKNNYREDICIYDDCGAWKTKTEREINLVRAVFVGESKIFNKLVAMTFFIPAEKFESNGFKIPSSIPVPAKIRKACDNIDSIKYVSDCLKMDLQESKLLQVAYRLQSINEIYFVCNDLYNSSEMSRLEMYSKCLDKSVKEIRLLLKRDHKLFSYGLLDKEGDMDQDCVDAISEKDMNLYFCDIIKKEKKLQSYDLDSYSINEDKTNLAIQFLKSSNPCNILLYGAPGSGKTEYAKSLIKAAGLSMTTYKNEIEVGGNCNGEEDTGAKALGRLNCYLSLKKEDTILMVDEAETILRTTGSFFGMKYSLASKGTVNNMLSNSENRVIWVLNYTDELDESTLRRFTYSIRFHEMPKSTLRSIAEKKFETVNIPSNLKSQILDMCGKYQVTGASVDNIVKAVKSMDCNNQNQSQVMKDVRNVLEANSSLVFGKKKMRDTVKDSYNLSILNTSIPAPELVEMVENAITNMEEQQGQPEGIRMLFYGLSGTGKTELARYLSEKTGKKLLLKRASDILDKYVGETEKSIKEIFQEAEETNQILLLDEADSFFTDRSSVNNSYERTMVNELLTQMEEFSGILICTSNFRKVMDPAMQRRFHIMMEFKPLTSNGIRTLLDSYFGDMTFSEELISGLLKYNSVTPGDFGNLKSKLRFVAKAKITPEYVIQELKTIQNEKRMNGLSCIGFAS